MARLPEDIKNSEYARLTFVARRDGIEGMLDFAKRTYAGYKTCLRPCNDGKISPYGKVYRLELLCSCIVFRKVIREQGRLPS